MGRRATKPRGSRILSGYSGRTRDSHLPSPVGEWSCRPFGPLPAHLLPRATVMECQERSRGAARLSSQCNDKNTSFGQPPEKHSGTALNVKKAAAAAGRGDHMSRRCPINRDRPGRRRCKPGLTAGARRVRGAVCLARDAFDCVDAVRTVPLPATVESVEFALEIARVRRTRRCRIASDGRCNIFGDEKNNFEIK